MDAIHLILNESGSMIFQRYSTSNGNDFVFGYVAMPMDFLSQEMQRKAFLKSTDSIHDQSLPDKERWFARVENILSDNKQLAIDVINDCTVGSCSP